METPPSDVVELIIAVDLNPSDPEEPLNVNDVQVRDKGAGGEEGGEDWRGLTMQLLMGDPAAGVTSDDLSYEEAVQATERALGGSEEAEMGDDPFSAHMAGGPAEEAGPPMGKQGGGMKAALDKALGREGGPDDEDDEELFR